MAGKIFGVICMLSVACAILTGNTQNLSPAIFEGAARAVELTIALTSMMCLWSGVLSVFKDIGIIEKGAKLISPLLKFLFPDAYKKKNGIDECAANIAANILGIGNAATPFALAAMQKMSENSKEDTSANDDMIMLAVLNSSPVSIMPVTLITLRTIAESKAPEAVLIPIWICSTLGAVFAITTTKACGYIWKKCKIKRKVNGVPCKKSPH